jgi:Glutamine synthetase, beta-Grasp domain
VQDSHRKALRGSTSYLCFCSDLCFYVFQEYIWYDGLEGAPEKGVVFNEMRSKTKVLQDGTGSLDPKDYPDWSFDGSSTGQAEGNNSDCILKCARPATVRLGGKRGGGVAASSTLHCSGCPQHALHG